MQWWASASMITFRCWYHFRATKYLLVVLSRFIRNPIDKLFCVDLFTAISDQDIGRVIEHIWALFFRSLTVFRNTAHRYLVELVTVLPIRIVIWVLVSDTALRCASLSEIGGCDSTCAAYSMEGSFNQRSPSTKVHVSKDQCDWTRAAGRINLGPWMWFCC